MFGTQDIEKSFDPAPVSVELSTYVAVLTTQQLLPKTDASLATLIEATLLKPAAPSVDRSCLPLSAKVVCSILPLTICSSKGQTLELT